MAMKGRVGNRRYTKRKSRPISNDSDESDEDYTLEEDETEESGNETEESLGESEEEEEEKFRKVARSKGKKIPGVRKKSRIGKKPKKSSKSYTLLDDEDDDDDFIDEDYDCDEDEDDEFEEEEEEEEDVEVRKVSRSKGKKVSGGRKKNGVGKKRKRRSNSRKLADDDDFIEEDYDDSEDEDEDDEFRPDESDSDDEDEVIEIDINKKARRPLSRKKNPAKGRQRKRIRKVLKKPTRKNPTKVRGQRRRRSAGSGSSISEKSPVAREESKKQKRKRSFIVDSGPSDLEYDTSDEQREQVIEASQFCMDLTTSLRNSYSPKRLLGESFVGQQRKRSERKGKEKVEDAKEEAAKQVCGICLSEEGINAVQGKLNCCSHYFCFVCVMEWSKVESRCPLCKQRFVTVSKIEKSKTGLDLKTVVVQVPERDQVYQPSEEELRGYLDPYENAICTECQLGGDDALMLLCDLCDSPAHTYCVGLGRVVPEDNWYCEGCRPTAFAPSSEAPFLTPNQRRTNDLPGRSPPVETVDEPIDLNSLYVPETPQSQVAEASPFHRRPARDFQVTSPTSGMGVLTVLDRRRMQHQIRTLRNNRIDELSSRNSGLRRLPASMFGNSLLNPTVERRREFSSQQANAPERLASHQAFSNRRLQDSLTLFGTDRSRASHSRDQPIQDPASTSVAASASTMLQTELPGTSTGMSSSIAGDGSSWNGYRETTISSRSWRGAPRTLF